MSQTNHKQDAKSIQPTVRFNLSLQGAPRRSKPEMHLYLRLFSNI